MTLYYHDRNLKNIENLADHTKIAALKWYEYLVKNDIDVLIYETIRTEAQQRENVRKGASQTMKSYHLVGQALDFVPVAEGGRTDWNGYTQTKIKQAVAEAKRLGFEWGGDWKSFIDRPHLQYNHKGYGTDTFGKVSVPKPQPVKTYEATNEIKYIHTGGYAGDALKQVHDYLITTGHGFDTKRGADGSIIFLIGPFDTGQANFADCKHFLDKNKHGYSLIDPVEAAEWKNK